MIELEAIIDSWLVEKDLQLEKAGLPNAKSMMVRLLDLMDI